MKLDYKQANEIRLKYPKKLSQTDIDSIIAEWVSFGVEQDYMLYFSSKYELNSKKMQLCDFDLYCQASRKFDYIYVKETIERQKREGSKSDLSSLFVFTAIANVENMCAFNDSYKVEKKTKAIRKAFAIGALDDLKSLIGSDKLSDGIKEHNEIRDSVEKKYPCKYDSWQKEVTKIIQSYVLQETT